MKRIHANLILGFGLLCASSWLAAEDFSGIDNYRRYSPYFSSSGQPDGEQLEALSGAGFQRIVYLAFSDNKSALEHEDRVVKSLGMDYLQIPVDFEQPAIDDFEDFAAVLNRDRTIRTLLHCQVNMRASTFGFLYRVIYDHVPMATAKSDLDSVWQPNRVWYRFIVDVLASHGLSPACDGCDWGSNEFED